MKSISRLLFMLSVATALTVPGESAAQSVCEGLSTVLKELKSSRGRDNLEFYTLPGATCRVKGRTYICDWSMPKRDLDTITRVSELDEWERNSSKELKKLAGAFQQCIAQKKVPYNWNSFKKKRKNGWIRKYYIYTKPFPRLSIVLCAFSYSLTEGWLRLAVIYAHHNNRCESL